MTNCKDDSLMWDKAIEHLDSDDISGALFLLKKLYHNGNEAAPAMIAAIYSSEPTIDYSKAKKWNSIAAYESEDIMGYIGLADMYFRGLEVNKSNEKALGLLYEIRENENHLAMLLEGKIHLEMNKLTFARKSFSGSYKLGNAIALQYISEIDYIENKYFSWIINRVRAYFKRLKMLSKNPHDQYALNTVG